VSVLLSGKFTRLHLYTCIYTPPGLRTVVDVNVFTTSSPPEMIIMTMEMSTMTMAMMMTNDDHR